MITIKAKIKLYKGKNTRKTAFQTGYRPLFYFIPETKTSGQISLINQHEFFPGEEGIVKINFLHIEYLGNDFAVGKKFAFSEGHEILGEGEVLEILNL